MSKPKRRPADRSWAKLKRECVRHGLSVDRSTRSVQDSSECALDKPVLTAPRRDVLRQAFDQAVDAINRQRNATNPQRDQLITPFYKQVGDAVFYASYAALCDGCTPSAAQIQHSTRNRLHLISAPVGSGKSSFAIAFITAVARTYPALGCLLAVDQIERADNCYHQLKTLIPGKVAIWTSDHDPKRRRDDDPERKVHVASEDRYRKDQNREKTIP